jgi:integrase
VGIGKKRKEVREMKNYVHCPSCNRRMKRTGKKKIVNMEQVGRMKEPKTLPKYLMPQEQEALISAAKNGNGAKRIGSYSRERTYLLILLLLDCGLRKRVLYG